VALLAPDHVGAVARADAVVAATSVDDIVTDASEDHVVAGSTRDDFARICARRDRDLQAIAQSAVLVRERHPPAGRRRKTSHRTPRL
jgi:hypothetical protein